MIPLVYVCTQFVREFCNHIRVKGSFVWVLQLWITYFVCSSFLVCLVFCWFFCFCLFVLVLVCHSMY